MQTRLQAISLSPRSGFNLSRLAQSLILEKFPCATYFQTPIITANYNGIDKAKRKTPVKKENTIAKQKPESMNEESIDENRTVIPPDEETTLPGATIIVSNEGKLRRLPTPRFKTDCGEIK